MLSNSTVAHLLETGELVVQLKSPTNVWTKSAWELSKRLNIAQKTPSFGSSSESHCAYSLPGIGYACGQVHVSVHTNEKRMEAEARIGHFSSNSG